MFLFVCMTCTCFYVKVGWNERKMARRIDFKTMANDLRMLVPSNRRGTQLFVAIFDCLLF